MQGLHCAFTGRLGGEPEQRYSQRGTAMLTFSVAVDESGAALHTAATEDRPAAETRWVRVTCSEERALELAEVLHRGSLVYVEGKLKLDRWTKPDGTPQSGLSLSAWTCQPMGVGRKTSRGLRNGEPYRRPAGAQSWGR